MDQRSNRFFHQELPHSYCNLAWSIVVEQEKIVLLSHFWPNLLNSFHKLIHDTMIVNGIDFGTTVHKFLAN